MAEKKSRKRDQSGFVRLSYGEQLRDPRWQRMRLKVLERDNWECQQCGDTSATLNVHHAYYRKNAAVWDYPTESLSTLCEKCHARREELLLRLRKLVGNIDDNLLGIIVGFAATLSAWCCGGEAEIFNEAECGGVNAALKSLFPSEELRFEYSDLLQYLDGDKSTVLTYAVLRDAVNELRDVLQGIMETRR